MAEPQQSPAINFKASKKQLQIALTHLNQQANGYDKILGYLKLSDICEQQHDPSCSLALRQQALADAKLNQESRALAYSYGYLGRLYLQQKHYAEAQKLSQQALFFAQQSQNREQIYLWAWQLGKSLKQQNQAEAAIQAYQLATQQLKPIQSQVSSCGYQLKLGNFREQIAPVYFELADLLLANHNAQPERLEQAMATIELFKQAELQDYLQQSCITPQRKVALRQILEPNTAVLYPILLKDRTALLLGFQNKLIHIPVPVSKNQLRQQTLKLQTALSIHPNPVTKEDERGFSRGFSRSARDQHSKDSAAGNCVPLGQQRTPHLSQQAKQTLQYALDKIQKPAQQLYQWLIEPLQSHLKAQHIDTLIIVPDGVLRTIPFASLYDGKQYLIEQYALVTSPGLQLSQADSNFNRNASILLGGVSESVQGFRAIPCVDYELKQIHQLYGQTDNLLLNKDFTLKQFKQQMQQKSYNILHLASHGQFSNRLEDTFLLTHDGKISINELSNLVRLMSVQDKAVELLTLSACETALGDDKAALGLAGIALKSGAKSTIASLWQVDDEATPTVIIEFYRQLKEGQLNKAKALQQAQLKLLHNPTLQRYSNPYFWSAFLLIGHWL